MKCEVVIQRVVTQAARAEHFTIWRLEMVWSTCEVGALEEEQGSAGNARLQYATHSKRKVAIRDSLRVGSAPVECQPCGKKTALRNRIEGRRQREKVCTGEGGQAAQLSALP